MYAGIYIIGIDTVLHGSDELYRCIYIICGLKGYNIIYIEGLISIRSFIYIIYKQGLFPNGVDFVKLPAGKQTYIK